MSQIQSDGDGKDNDGKEGDNQGLKEPNNKNDKKRHEKEGERERKQSDSRRERERRRQRNESEEMSGGEHGEGKEEDGKHSRRRKTSRHRRDDVEESDEGSLEKEEEERRRRRRRRSRREKEEERRKRRKRKKVGSSSSSRRRRKRRERSRKRRRRSRSSSSSSSGDDSSDSSSSGSSSSNSSSSESVNKTSSKRNDKTSVKKVANEKLLQKLAARGETLQEREERRAQRRAARIAAQFGYTAEENPFNDPNIAETFTWKKREEKNEHNDTTTTNTTLGRESRRSKQDKTFLEIEKVRNRRREHEQHMEEMERIRAEESRMKEVQHYDEWAKKEEEFHLQQQRQRSAIRLVEGRERPVDVLAKNLLLFGLTEDEKKNRAAVKYKEKYNALDELETLEAELEEPHLFLKDLKLVELEELLMDVNAFCTLEREAARENGYGDTRNDDGGDGDHNPVLRYWDALSLVTRDEIRYVQSGGESSSETGIDADVQAMFEGQSRNALLKMKEEIERKLKVGTRDNDAPAFDGEGVIDTEYWKTVLQKLEVHLAKLELSDIHSKMLVCQLEKLERRKDLLGKASLDDREKEKGEFFGDENGAATMGGDGVQNGEEGTAGKDGNGNAPPKGVDPDFGNLEEELGLSNEIDLGSASYAWQEKYRPRKPRYFNRVKTGYDWNKYNQTHYDHDNPPPKTVQGYKFNIFYPDLIDRTATPQYVLEPAESGEFCIIRFRAGPPYEDVAFKVINREWNRSRKRGFRCTFERGVLSLYFNFSTHWYRR